MLHGAAGIGRSADHDAAGIGRFADHDAAGIGRSAYHDAAGCGRGSIRGAAGIGRFADHDGGWAKAPPLRNRPTDRGTCGRLRCCGDRWVMIAALRADAAIITR
jgi:hypothetical protein